MPDSKSLTAYDGNSVSTRERNATAEKSVICDLGEKSLILFSGLNDRGLLKLMQNSKKPKRCRENFVLSS